MAATNTCPAGLSCTSVDDQPMCTKGGKGCAYAGGTPDRSALALLLVAFGLLALRRRRA
jgi:MYXO-CTERM domain-containing protein